MTHVCRHTKAGVLTMANSGRDTNTSVFCLTVKPMQHLGKRCHHCPCHMGLQARTTDGDTTSPASCCAATVLNTCAKSSLVLGCGFVTADGKHVAFGTVVSGQEVVTAISQLFHVDGKPLQDVVIADCGIVQ